MLTPMLTPYEVVTIDKTIYTTNTIPLISVEMLLELCGREGNSSHITESSQNEGINAAVIMQRSGELLHELEEMFGDFDLSSK